MIREEDGRLAIKLAPLVPPDDDARPWRAPRHPRAGVHQRAAHGALLQHVQPGDRRPARTGDRILQRARMLARAEHHLRSAERTRTEYPGPWLPEPVAEPDRESAELASSLTTAFLVLLESLSPVERAVFLLREVFDYDYEAIAGIVGKSEDNVRQLASRARRHVEQGRPRFQSTRGQRDELARRFFEAAEQGDLAGLESLLAHDVQLTGDGGGKAPALARTLRGRSRVARVLMRWLSPETRLPGIQLRPTEVNGGPGMLVFDDCRRLVGVSAFEIADGEFKAIRSVANPDKLSHLGVPVGNLGSVIKATPPLPPPAAPL